MEPLVSKQPHYVHKKKAKILVTKILRILNKWINCYSGIWKIYILIMLNKNNQCLLKKTTKSLSTNGIICILDRLKKLNYYIILAK